MPVSISTMNTFGLHCPFERTYPKVPTQSSSARRRNERLEIPPREVSKPPFEQRLHVSRFMPILASTWAKQLQSNSIPYELPRPRNESFGVYTLNTSSGPCQIPMKSLSVFSTSSATTLCLNRPRRKKCWVYSGSMEPTDPSEQPLIFGF